MYMVIVKRAHFRGTSTECHEAKSPCCDAQYCLTLIGVQTLSITYPHIVAGLNSLLMSVSFTSLVDGGGTKDSIMAPPNGRPKNGFQNSYLGGHKCFGRKLAVELCCTKSHLRAFSTGKYFLTLYIPSL